MSRPALTQRPQTHPAVAAALADCRRAFWSIALFSGVVNLLMLAGPIYMLQIYDRVLASRSVPTLIALSVFLVGAYAFQGILDLIRSRIVVRSAAVLDERLGTTVHGAVMRLAIMARNPGDAHQPLRDLDSIRTFLTGAGPLAIVDLPWMPVFLFFCFLIHFWLGVLALAGALVLVVMTIRTERSSREPSRALAQDAGTRMITVETHRRNSETALAMGMMATLAKRWEIINQRYLGAVERSTDITTSYGSITKVFRLLIQSAMLGLGAYFVIRQELTAGGMIAASIMMGRALAPVETAIANWRSFIGARDSVRRLSEMLARLREDGAATALPKPKDSLEVTQLVVVPPGTQTLILSNVQFRLSAGEALGVIGPSGSGKTSLVRTVLGIWPPAKGTVRLDGAALDQWDAEVRGRFVGYVSQAVDLFDGTIAENIARMEDEPDAKAVLAAAQAAGAHDMILRMPSGYDTRIGESGVVLSAGQRQRIALARAFYGDPFLVVLDEPNSNLDADGEAALQNAVLGFKARGSIIVLITHRPSALAACDKVLFLANGTQHAFGPRDDVMRKVMQQRQAQPAVGNLKVVGEPSGGGER